MKLNLGCGNKKLKGYVNCDVSPQVKPDKIVDLEKKLPFKTNSVEEIYMGSSIEHVVNFVPLMHELHRICRKGSTIEIITSFYSAWGQYNDPTHVRFFTPFTFNYFKKGNYSHEVGADKDMFEVEKVKLNFGIGKSRKLNWLFNPILNLNHRIYCRFFAFIFPASEIYYKLKVIK